MRNELSESFEHLRLAVGHAAGSTTSLVRPRVATARRSVSPALRRANRATAATVMPIALAARTGARTGALKGKAILMRKEPRVKRWPMMLGGLLAAGAAVGAAGALIARRRANRSQWEEYGTPGSGISGRAGTTDSKSGIRSATESGKDRVQSLAESAKERAADLMGTSSSSAETPEFGSRQDLYGKAGSANSRS